MTHPFVAMIEQRNSVNQFDASRPLPSGSVQELVRLATRAPSAFNLQNWRFIAVQTPDAKARLRRVAGNQEKITEAAVTFIICGVSPHPAMITERLRPSVEAGFMPQHIPGDWEEGVRSMYVGQAQMQRDEAIRSATFAAATLIFAAQTHGLGSCPMVGFDPEGVRRAFDIGADEVPVVLVAVGHAAEGNWPQKPRRAVSEVLHVI